MAQEDRWMAREWDGSLVEGKVTPGKPEEELPPGDKFLTTVSYYCGGQAPDRTDAPKQSR